jgi:hypothetical protein
VVSRYGGLEKLELACGALRYGTLEEPVFACGVSSLAKKRFQDMETWHTATLHVALPVYDKIWRTGGMYIYD